ncbi:MAG: discoidin domain-containing protein [Bacteroidaceae bacterium]|nr:discoidin domain-containing protein [Bacteroidaceae bacterium]
MKKSNLTAIFASALLVVCSCSAPQNSLEELRQGWENPPMSARNRVWWHWMNGNITKEGILKDLQWMKDTRQGGVHNFDAALGTPTIVDKRLIYMDDGWQDAFAYAVKVADSLGLEFTVASAPGWSSTGGPWVSEKDAMKKLVWSETFASGNVDATLPEPPHTTGAFLDGSPAGRGTAGSNYEYYEDIAVLAVKQPVDRQNASALGAKVSSSGGNFSLEQLTNGSIADAVMLPRDDKAGFAWIQYEFPAPVTVKSLKMVGAGGGPASTQLEASDDGKTFTHVCDIRGGGVAQVTMTVPATTAKYFRIKVANPRAAGGGFFGMGGGPSAPPAGTMIAELELYPYSRVHRFEDKAAFSSTSSLTSMPTVADAGEAFPTTDDVVDVTDFYKNGKLTWNAPEGNWKIIRFGWSLTGKQNHPAPLEATGLEVDKLDPEAWTRYFHTYFDMYKKAAGGLMGQQGVQYVLTDSYEAECETWTPAMFQEFNTRRGYDLKTWLPVLSGEIIGSPKESDAFLFDWRTTIGELIADNYTLLSKIAKEEYGMKGRYTESHEGGRAYVGDGMDLKATAEVPMSAMWVTAPWVPVGPDGQPDMSVYDADDKESASVAHIYGQNIAAAESMTAPGGGGKSYSYHPGNLKHVADRELSNGINRFVIHESAHQPDDVHVPGMSLGGIGQWFNRHDSWAPMAGIWADYMSRSSFMLQAGLNVADILYYYGEDANVTSTFQRSPNIPAGYQWDYLNPDGLLNHISFEKGQMVSTGGTTYKVLWMDRNMEVMSVPVLRKIASLVKAGAFVGGVRPKGTASVTDDEAEFAALIADIWDSGRKNVVETKELTDLLNAAGVATDVNIPAGYKFLHRTLKGAEVYWVNKPAKDYQTVTLSFRVSGLKPMLWHPDSGVQEEVSHTQHEGRTEVTLDLVPDDAVFVVFAGKAEQTYTVPAEVMKNETTLEGTWTVKFQEKRGAPASAVFAALGSYTEADDPGIKYFSGIANYTKTFEVAQEGKTVLDLGRVADLAEVYVNGQYCGAVWKEPYRLDISQAVKPGENSLEVKVANVWVNRLIGDEQPGATRIGWTDAQGFNGNEPLLPAGLLGPVKLVNY